MKQTWSVSAVANWSRLSAIKKMLRICARNWAANFWATNKHCYDTDLNITKSTDRAFTLTALKWSGYSKGIQPMSLRKYSEKVLPEKKQPVERKAEREWKKRHKNLYVTGGHSHSRVAGRWYWGTTILSVSVTPAQCSYQRRLSDTKLLGCLAGRQQLTGHAVQCRDEQRVFIHLRLSIASVVSLH